MSIGETTHLSHNDALLVKIYIVGCINDWEKLPSLAKEFYAHGGTVAQLRGCLRHLIVLAGYGPCLAAQLTLQKAKLLPEETPAKAGGPNGNAFDLVYTTVSSAVRRKVHSADAALGYWIENHLYGDIYSSPGLDLKRKQLIMCARLAQANMGDQLFGHALAALRFGNTKDQLVEGIGIAYDLSPYAKKEKAHNDALKILDLADAKYKKDYGTPQGPIEPPEIYIPDPSSIRIPEIHSSALDSNLNVGEKKEEEPKKAEKKVDPSSVSVDTNPQRKDDAAVKFCWELLAENAKT